ncbi:MAG: glycosyltransferase family 2 protein [Pirellulales bacterium]
MRADVVVISMVSHAEINPVDVSVLIATRDRGALLRQTLESLARQQLDGITWEVIVVDNGSSDATPSVLEEAASHLPLVSIQEPRPGKNRALNKALDVARGDLLVFTDDDVIPEPGWISELVAASKRWPDDSIFCGPIVPAFPPNTPEWISDPAFSFGIGAFGRYDPSDRETPVAQSPFGANLALRRQVFTNDRFCEHIGPSGTQYAMGSETELLARLHRRGERFIFVPPAKVQHVIEPHQVTLKWLSGRAFRAARGAARLAPDRSSPRLFGVPRYLWRQYAETWLRRLASLPRGERARTNAAIALNLIRGRCYEYRLSRGEL